MSIMIDKSRCAGCGQCSIVCPGSLIKMGEDKKAYIKYPKDCWGCSSCLKECKFEAIALYLGADMGGMGSKMSVTTKGDYLNWNIDKTDGSRAENITKCVNSGRRMNRITIPLSRYWRAGALFYLQQFRNFD